MQKVNNSDPILRTICKPVDCVNDEVRKALDDMIDYCKNNTRPQVLSLAANQVGINKRLIVIFMNDEILKLANPVITKTSGKEIFFEACANVDYKNYFVGGFVERPAYVEVEALDYNNDKVIIKANGVLAVMIQHEIDHLDGILYTDKLVGELHEFGTPEDRIEYRKAHPLDIIEEPTYEKSDYINKLLKNNRR